MKKKVNIKIPPRDKNKEVNRLSGESDEIYVLKCLNKTDINMIRARQNFERPAYYVKKNESGQDLGFNPYQE